MDFAAELAVSHSLILSLSPRSASHFPSYSIRLPTSQFPIPSPLSLARACRRGRELLTFWRIISFGSSSRLWRETQRLLGHRWTVETERLTKQIGDAILFALAAIVSALAHSISSTQQELTCSLFRHKRQNQHGHLSATIEVEAEELRHLRKERETENRAQKMEPGGWSRNAGTKGYQGFKPDCMHSQIKLVS